MNMMIWLLLINITMIAVIISFFIYHIIVTDVNLTSIYKSIQDTKYAIQHTQTNINETRDTITHSLLHNITQTISRITQNSTSHGVR